MLLCNFPYFCFRFYSLPPRTDCTLEKHHFDFNLTHVAFKHPLTDSFNFPFFFFSLLFHSFNIFYLFLVCIRYSTHILCCVCVRQRKVKRQHARATPMDRLSNDIQRKYYFAVVVANNTVGFIVSGGKVSTGCTRLTYLRCYFLPPGPSWGFWRPGASRRQGFFRCAFALPSWRLVWQWRPWLHPLISRAIPLRKGFYRN